jgi:hypothetical protein
MSLNCRLLEQKPAGKVAIRYSPDARQQIRIGRFKVSDPRSGV